MLHSVAAFMVTIGGARGLLHQSWGWGCMLASRAQHCFAAFPPLLPTIQAYLALRRALVVIRFGALSPVLRLCLICPCTLRQMALMGMRCVVVLIWGISHCGAAMGSDSCVVPSAPRQDEPHHAVSRGAMLEGQG